ncbi:MAG: hypothetical protein RJA22_2584 [Verrucomicrobiota bacterium]|jgi:hypothetical protein
MSFNECTMAAMIALERETQTDVMTVLVCHDTPAAERQARALLRRLVHRFDDGLEFEVRAWCCEELDWEDIPSRAQAHADATAATFCVVAWGGTGRPAPGLRRLVEEWAQVHRATPAMLAVLHAGDGPNRHLVEELRRAADRAGVDIFPAGEGDTSCLQQHEPPKAAPTAPTRRTLGIHWDEADHEFSTACLSSLRNPQHGGTHARPH